MKPFVKICGLTRAEDAGVAQAAGATYAGVILAPGSPRSISVKRAAEVFAGTSLIRCGVFVNEDPARVVEAAEQAGLAVVQLHGDESPEYAAALRGTSGLEVWKAVRPRSGEEFAAAAAAYGSVVDALLLDGWSATARGGTGARFPWAAVAAHRDLIAGGTRLIAAGGLRPDNVAEVIEALRPDGVDVSSGVEREPGRKDPGSIHDFVAAVRAAPAWKGVA